MRMRPGAVNRIRSLDSERTAKANACSVWGRRRLKGEVGSGGRGCYTITAALRPHMHLQARSRSTYLIGRLSHAQTALLIPHTHAYSDQQLHRQTRPADVEA